MEGLIIMIRAAFVALVVMTVLVLFAERFAKGYVPMVIAAVLAGVTIVADIMAGAKFIEVNFFGWLMEAEAGTFVFPVILLGVDYLNEFYGKTLARFAVIGGWLAKIYMALLFPFLLSDYLPWAGFAVEFGQDEMAKIILGLAPRIAIVSIIAYLLAGLSNVHIYAWLMKLTKGKHLWLRNNVSSNVAMLFDTILFVFGAFLFVLPIYVVINMVFAQIIMKWITNWMDTIFLYLMAYLKTKGIITGKQHKESAETGAV